GEGRGQIACHSVSDGNAGGGIRLQFQTQHARIGEQCRMLGREAVEAGAEGDHQIAIATGGYACRAGKPAHQTDIAWPVRAMSKRSERSAMGGPKPESECYRRLTLPRPY